MSATVDLEKGPPGIVLDDEARLHRYVRAVIFSLKLPLIDTMKNARLIIGPLSHTLGSQESQLEDFLNTEAGQIPKCKGQPCSPSQLKVWQTTARKLHGDLRLVLVPSRVHERDGLTLPVSRTYHL